MCSVILVLAICAENGEASYSNSNSNGSPNDDSNNSPNYRFQYGVYDSKTKNDFGHEEERNGYETKGQYKVQLPDGRLQVVTYVADKNGYRADVTYQKVSGSGSGSGYSSTNNNNNNYGAPAADSSSSLSASSAYGNNNNANQHNQRSSGSFSTLKTKINGKFYGY